MSSANNVTRFGQIPQSVKRLTIYYRFTCGKGLAMIPFEDTPTVSGLYSIESCLFCLYLNIFWFFVIYLFVFFFSNSKQDTLTIRTMESSTTTRFLRQVFSLQRNCGVSPKVSRQLDSKQLSPDRRSCHDDDTLFFHFIYWENKIKKFQFFFFFFSRDFD